MLAHEVIKATNTANNVGKAGETIVFFHGLLGRRNNLRSFAKKCLAVDPTYFHQALLVDTRGHGESSLGKQELTYGLSETLSKASPDELQVIFHRMNP